MPLPGPMAKKTTNARVETMTKIPMPDADCSTVGFVSMFDVPMMIKVEQIIMPEIKVLLKVNYKSLKKCKAFLNWDSFTC